MNRNKNNYCDSDKCVSATGEVRVLPQAGNGNSILCRACHAYELRWRKDRNRELSSDAQYTLPAWESLAIYSGANIEASASDEELLTRPLSQYSVEELEALKDYVYAQPGILNLDYLETIDQEIAKKK